MAEQPDPEHEMAHLQKMGGGIVESLYDALWARYQAGKTTFGGQEDTILQVAKMVGADLTREEFVAVIREADAVKHGGKKGNELQLALHNVVSTWRAKRVIPPTLTTPTPVEPPQARSSPLLGKPSGESISDQRNRLAAMQAVTEGMEVPNLASMPAIEAPPDSGAAVGALGQGPAETRGTEGGQEGVRPVSPAASPAPPPLSAPSTPALARVPEVLSDAEMAALEKQYGKGMAAQLAQAGMIASAPPPLAQMTPADMGVDVQDPPPDGAIPVAQHFGDVPVAQHFGEAGQPGSPAGSPEPAPSEPKKPKKQRDPMPSLQDMLSGGLGMIGGRLGNIQGLGGITASEATGALGFGSMGDIFKEIPSAFGMGGSEASEELGGTDSKAADNRELLEAIMKLTEAMQDLTEALHKKQTGGVDPKTGAFTPTLGKDTKMGETNAAGNVVAPSKDSSMTDLLWKSMEMAMKVVAAL